MLVRFVFLPCVLRVLFFKVSLLGGGFIVCFVKKENQPPTNHALYNFSDATCKDVD